MHSRTSSAPPRTLLIEGMAADGVTQVGVVGRFTGGGRYLIITTYAIT